MGLSRTTVICYDKAVNHHPDLCKEQFTIKKLNKLKEAVKRQQRRTMASENFVQPAIPRFDGHYDHWSMLMENFLRSKEYWQVVDSGVAEPAAGATLTETQKSELEALKLKDLKAKNYLFQAIDRSILETILCKDSSKLIWDSMKKKYQGNTRAKRVQLQALRREFEVLKMQPGESVSEYFSKTMAIANKMRIYGDKLEDVTIVEKILRSMTTKFNFVICSIEESKEIDTLSIDELQNSLLVHEQKITQQDQEEQALKAAFNPRGAGRGKGKGKGKNAHQKPGESKGADHSQGNWRGRDGQHSTGYKSQSADKSKSLMVQMMKQRSSLCNNLILLTIKFQQPPTLNQILQQQNRKSKLFQQVFHVPTVLEGAPHGCPTMR
ncbi:hypothetical protein Vadar_020022 [Vaccinium darrowii]|uniref:Uncharacterized protein n=1 Tax=Vaccinium darrowii TaxID=229202 RepID=A0ACB7YX89_9ERIC|nr:hypothetical protein Vadar_020022 [Vaccinium darrowii]